MTNIFQRGWNHQLVKLCRCFCWWSMIFNNPGGWFSLLQILVELAGPILPWLWHAWWASLLWSSGRTCGKDKGWKPHLAFNLQSIQIALLPASIFFEKRWPLWKVHWWFHMISFFFWGGALFYFPLFPLRIFDQLQLHYTDRLLPGIPRCFTTSAWVANSLIALEKSGFLGFVCHRSGCMRRLLFFFLGGEKHGTWLVIRVALGCWELGKGYCVTVTMCVFFVFFLFCLKHQTRISRILHRNTVVVPSEVLHDLFKVRSAFMITWSLLRLPWNQPKFSHEMWGTSEICGFGSCHAPGIHDDVCLSMKIDEG